MAVFKQEFNKEGGTDTIIGPSVKVEGDFTSQGNIIIEGEVKGNIKTKENLKVGQNSKIEANINVNNALISGEIRGNVKVKDKLQLTSTAKIFGDVEAKVLSVSEGAVLNGKCIMGGSEEKVILERPEKLSVSKVGKK